MRSLITVLAFAGKEMRQVLRQPKLMAVLILGPFLILGLFAAGFQATPPPLRTLVILPEGSDLESSLPQIQEQLGSEIELVGTSNDTAAGRQRLPDGEVDLVVEARPMPPRPSGTTSTPKWSSTTTGWIRSTGHTSPWRRNLRSTSSTAWSCPGWRRRPRNGPASTRTRLSRRPPEHGDDGRGLAPG